MKQINDEEGSHKPNTATVELYNIPTGELPHQEIKGASNHKSFKLDDHKTTSTIIYHDEKNVTGIETKVEIIELKSEGSLIKEPRSENVEREKRGAPLINMEQRAVEPSNLCVEYDPIVLNSFKVASEKLMEEEQHPDNSTLEDECIRTKATCELLGEEKEEVLTTTDEPIKMCTMNQEKKDVEEGPCEVDISDGTRKQKIRIVTSELHDSQEHDALEWSKECNDLGSNDQSKEPVTDELTVSTESKKFADYDEPAESEDVNKDVCEMGIRAMES